MPGIVFSSANMKVRLAEKGWSRGDAVLLFTTEINSGA